WKSSRPCPAFPGTWPSGFMNRCEASSRRYERRRGLRWRLLKQRRSTGWPAWRRRGEGSASPRRSLLQRTVAERGRGMDFAEERKVVLRLLREGRIEPDEADQLLRALERAEARARADAGGDAG